LIVKVPCQHRTWQTAKPQISAKNPPAKNVSVPAAIAGTIQ
jgi:hypothetical protein